MLSVKGVKGDMNVLTKEQMEEIYRRNCDMVYRVCLLQLKHEQDGDFCTVISEKNGFRRYGT